LSETIRAATERNSETVGGFDGRLIFKIETDSAFLPDELSRISPEIEVVSQEARGVIIAFATHDALAAFEAKLSSIMLGEKATYENVIFALDSFSTISPEDRSGRSLSEVRVGDADEVIVDVELFPIERHEERNSMVVSFRSFLQSEAIDEIDSMVDPSLVLHRVKLDGLKLRKLLRYRDVRKVDLPPKFAISAPYERFDIQDIPQPPKPPNNAPRIGILDSGIETGHPLLAPAIGEASVFCSTDSSVPAQDNVGHGTAVAGIALYRDVEKCILDNSFIPRFWLLSGRVLDDRGEYYSPTWEGSLKTSLIENDVEKAVKYFQDVHGCQIFNISFGDERRVYRGGRIEGLAVKLDSIARDRNVLFIVSTGNRGDHVPSDYPRSLLTDEGRLLDPATAVNAVTVGAIARYDQSHSAKRYYPSIITDRAVARRNEPAPVTRIGPSARMAIKPDFVEYSGNWAVGAGGALIKRGLGVLTTALTSVNLGRLIGEASGTSMAAPGVAHVAAGIKSRLPDADPILIRAIMACHAHVPIETSALALGADERKLSGYGQVDDEAVAESTDSDVTMVAVDSIQNDKVHFYEVPLPDEFVSTGKRSRHITVALSYFPPTRSTRVDYMASRITFNLVRGSVEDALRTFNAAVARGDVDDMPEYTNGRTVTYRDRSKGTLQMSRWNFTVGRSSAPKFVLIVTRNDPAWGDTITKPLESYALAVRVSDRGNPAADLYHKIAARLGIRVRARASGA